MLSPKLIRRITPTLLSCQGENCGLLLEDDVSGCAKPRIQPLPDNFWYFGSPDRYENRSNSADKLVLKFQRWKGTRKAFVNTRRLAFAQVVGDGQVPCWACENDRTTASSKV